MPLYTTIILYGNLAYENLTRIFSHGCGKNGSTIAVRNKEFFFYFFIKYFLNLIF